MAEARSPAVGDAGARVVVRGGGAVVRGARVADGAPSVGRVVAFGAADLLPEAAGPGVRVVVVAVGDPEEPAGGRVSAPVGSVVEVWSPWAIPRPAPSYWTHRRPATMPAVMARVARFLRRGAAAVVVTG